MVSVTLIGALERWTPQLCQAMLVHSGHHLDWRLRREFYKEVGDSLEARRFRGWLTILSAQHVLPLVLTATPWETQPLQDVEAAIRFLRGPARGGLTAAKDVSYHAHGNGMGFDLLAQRFHHNVDRAALAAYKALVEVSGWLDSFGPDAAYRFEGDIQAFDERLCGLAGAGDAAGTAAVASACSAGSTGCDPAKLRTFWLWWLESAIPLALRLSAENNRLYWS